MQPKISVLFLIFTIWFLPIFPANTHEITLELNGKPGVFATISKTTDPQFPFMGIAGKKKHLFKNLDDAFKFYSTMTMFPVTDSPKEIEIQWSRYKVKFSETHLNGKKISRTYDLFEKDFVKYTGVLGEEEIKTLSIAEAFQQFKDDVRKIVVLKKEEEIKKIPVDEFKKSLLAVQAAAKEISIKGDCPAQIKSLDHDIEELRKGQKPLGFKSQEEYLEMMMELKRLLKLKFKDLNKLEGIIFLKGSATTFVSDNPLKSDFSSKNLIRPTSLANIIQGNYHYFDKRGKGTSDIDVHLFVPELIKEMEKAKIAGPNKTRTSFVTDANFIKGYYFNYVGEIYHGAGDILGFLEEFTRKWSTKLGRKIELSVDTAPPHENDIFKLNLEENE